MLLAVLVGILHACGIYLLMRRSVVKLVIGIVLLGHATNLLVFVAGGARLGAAPLVPQGALQPAGPVSDPLPQALVLTAIVIGFGVNAFAIALVHRVHRAIGSDDVDDVILTEEEDAA